MAFKVSTLDPHASARFGGNPVWEDRGILDEIIKDGDENEYVVAKAVENAEGRVSSYDVWLHFRMIPKPARAPSSLTSGPEKIERIEDEDDYQASGPEDSEDRIERNLRNDHVAMIEEYAETRDVKTEWGSVVTNGMRALTSEPRDDELSPVSEELLTEDQNTQDLTIDSDSARGSFSDESFDDDLHERGSTINRRTKRHSTQATPSPFFCEESAAMSEKTDASSDTAGHGDFRCEWEECGSVHSDLSKLVGHVNQEHVGVKGPYACHWRGCRIRGKPQDRHKILRHMRTHTGEEPFRCTEFACPRSYKRREDLANHLRAAHPQPRLMSSPPSTGLPQPMILSPISHAFFPSVEKTFKRPLEEENMPPMIRSQSEDTSTSKMPKLTRLSHPRPRGKAGPLGTMESPHQKVMRLLKSAGGRIYEETETVGCL